MIDETDCRVLLLGANAHSNTTPSRATSSMLGMPAAPP